MKISIVILNYNVKYFVAACLESIAPAAKEKNVEIIVADNHSSDGSREYLEKLFPRIKFLWFDENYGFSKAYNKAVQYAQGDYLLILNPDTLISENLLQELENFAKSHSGFGVLGGKMIDGAGRFLPESKRGIPTPLAAFSKLTELYKLFNFKPFNNYYAGWLSPDTAGKVPVLTGAFMFLSKQTYESVGGFDERYFMYAEDIDLSYTILKSGKENYYVPSAKIIHFKGESTRKDRDYYCGFLQTTFQFYNKHFHSFPVQEFLMKRIFKLWLKLRLKKNKTSTTPTDFEEVFLYPKDENITTLKQVFPSIKSIENTSNIPKSSLLIFDTSILPFSQIIQEMEILQAKKIGFYFYFPKNKLLLGSKYKEHLEKEKVL